MRRFVIGDIHGCGKALRSLIETIAPQSDDEIIFLGDYVDRGPDSRDCVDQLISLRQNCRTVMLRGNHEIMLMAVTVGGLDPTMWLASGGVSTVASYGGSLAKVPTRHLEFLQSLRPYHETSDSIFVHACYASEVPIHKQDDTHLYWTHLSYPLPAPHMSGKRVFVGHTPQFNGYILDAGHLVCLDTYCFGGGYLTAYDLETGETYQTDRHGFLRRSPGRMWTERWTNCKRLIGKVLSRGRVSDSSQVAATSEIANPSIRL
jgi:serine/threonine protein phosphatase 1